MSSENPDAAEAYANLVSAQSRQQYLLYSYCAEIPASISGLTKFFQQGLRLRADAPTFSENDSTRRAREDTLLYHLYYSVHFSLCARMLIDFLLELIAKDVMVSARALAAGQGLEHVKSFCCSLAVCYRAGVCML